MPVARMRTCCSLVFGKELFRDCSVAPWTEKHQTSGRTQPDLAAMPNAALHANRLAMQRMPGIVNGYFFSVVGGM